MRGDGYQAPAVRQRLAIRSRGILLEWKMGMVGADGCRRAII